MPLLITPGYGISDYFALMPDKMLAIKVVPASKNILPGRIKSVSIYGTTVHLNLQKSIDFLPSRISLYTISGKIICQRYNPAKPSPDRTFLIPVPHLSKGIYFVKFETKTEKMLAKLVYSGK
jgi:hypothetical protein